MPSDGKCQVQWARGELEGFVDTERELNRSVLAVGAAPSIERLRESFFARAGCDVVSVADGAGAVEVGDELRPSLVLVSDLLANASAADEVRHIRETVWGASVTIIVVSDQTESAHADACFEAGCDDFVPSTTRTHELTCKAAAALDIPYRVHYRLVVDLQIEGKGPKGHFIGLARNISKGGLLVEAVDIAEVGDTVEVTLTLSRNSTGVTVTGRVVRIGWDDAKANHLLGIAFVDVDPAVQGAIDAFIGEV